MTAFWIDLGSVALLFAVAIAIGVVMNIWSQR